MTDESGFYAYEAESYTLLFGPNFVDGPYGSFSLRRDNPDDRDNAINGSETTGWYWFETEAEAIVFFNVQDPPPIDPDAP